MTPKFCLLGGSFALAICLAPINLWATQPTIPVGCQAAANLIIEAGSNSGLRNSQITHALDIKAFPDCFLRAPHAAPEASQKSESVQLLYKLGRQSANQQNGAPPATAGSTSVVSQPLTIMSLASEYGGLTTSSSNGTFTLQSALDQIAKHDITSSCTFSDDPKKRPVCPGLEALDFLHRISVGTTFNASTPSTNVNATAVGPVQGNAQQVSGTTNGNSAPSFSTALVKFVVWQDRADASGPWAKAVAGSSDVKNKAKILLDATQRIRDLVDQANPNFYQKWQACARSALQAVPDKDLAVALASYYKQLRESLFEGRPFDCPAHPENNAAPQIVPELQTTVQAALTNLENYKGSVADLARTLEQPIITVEYDYSTPQSQPSNSVFRFIFSKNWLACPQTNRAGNGQQNQAASKCSQNPSAGQANSSTSPNNKLTLTANAAVSIYNSTPSANISGASSLRDIQAGVEADFLLPSIPLLGQTTLGGAYYFQDQTSPSILKVTPGSPISGITFTGLLSTATQVFTQKGDIHVAQLKWALGAGKSVKFPIAFSYSNRTEVVTKPDWRGEFGINWDLTSLFGGQSNRSQ